MLSMSAQFSVQTRVHNGIQSEESTSIGSTVYEGSVHYWTRLKRYRLEFLPGGLYRSINTDQKISHNLGVTLPVSVYLLDFVNDCDCPTFSKNAYWFQKGFFLRLTPSWTTNINSNDEDSYDHLVSGGISAGLDIGLSDLLTLTPLIGYSQIHSFTEEHLKSDYVHIGVSILFRPDYRRKYR